MARRRNVNKASEHTEGPRALRAEEHASALHLLNHTLRPNGPHEILREYPLVLRKENIENMRVIVKNGEVVSHAAIYYSTLRAGDLRFKVGGIGSVATHASYRQRGFAGAVIRNCISLMHDSGCHISVLWTQNDDFYRKLGYETAGCEFLYEAKLSDFSNISSDCEVIPYARRLLADIIKIHDREVLRTERTTAEYEAYLSITKTDTLLAMRGGKVTAYAIMGKGEDFRNCIHEWGGNTGDLLKLIRQLAINSGRDQFLILAPAFGSDLPALLKKMRLRWTLEYLAMIKIINVEGLSSILRDYVRLRLGRDFAIRTLDQGFRIKLGDDQALLTSEGALARLIFGPDPASSLIRDLPRETASSLEKVFPIPLFIWGLDSV